MRINKYLAQIGIASRRKIDEMIKEGVVTVNGKIVKLGQLINSETDEIKIDGEKIGDRKEKKVYILLNKPKGYVSTAASFKGEKSVLDIVNSNFRLYPVGRLDKDSTGLIILTNDGQFTQKLTHPKFHIPKTYEMMIRGNVPKTLIDQLQNGVELEDGKTQPAHVTVMNKTEQNTWLRIILKEGKNRQIRRMSAFLHLHILELKRTAVGDINLGSLPIGKYRNLKNTEITALLKY